MDSKHISFWNEVHTIIDEAMEKHDRSVSVYISPEGAMSATVQFGLMNWHQRIC